MVQVGAYVTRSDAELAQTALAAAGIPSVVAADDAGGAYPFDLTGAARLLVDEADAEAAADVLSEGPRAHREEQPTSVAAREQTRGFHGCDGQTR